MSPFFQNVFSGTYLEELDKDLDLMIYFASCGRPSQYGSWGMIEAMDQPRDQAYKYQAVQDGKMLVGLRVKALLKIMVDIHQNLVK